MKRYFVLLFCLITLLFSCSKSDENFQDDEEANQKEEFLLPGLFTVSKTGKTVRFTKSNVYYDGSEFHFEKTPISFPVTYNSNHIGHFYWSKSLDIALAKEYSDPSADVYDIFFFSESNKRTIDGVSGCYVLSKDEWEFLLNRSNGKLVKNCAVDNVDPCLVIAPDGYQKTLKAEYTLDEIETEGLLCLPPSGIWGGDKMYYNGTEGDYWTSTPIYDNSYSNPLCAVSLRVWWDWYISDDERGQTIVSEPREWLSIAIRLVK